MSSPFALEVGLHWVAVALYMVAAVSMAISVIYGKPKALRVGLVAAAIGLLPHGAALAWRWSVVGHGPYILRYEVLSSNAWAAILVLVTLIARRPAWGAIGLVGMPLAILSVGLALFSNPEMRDLPPSLRSIWLAFHIIFAKISASAFLLSFCGAVLQLVRSAGSQARWLERVPAGPALDALIVRTAGLGFIFWTVTIAAGAIWGNQSWGRYWGWDPIETWALVSWLTYGSFLHLRLFFKTGERTTALLCALSFLIFVLAFLVMPFLLKSLHSAYFS